MLEPDSAGREREETSQQDEDTGLTGCQVDSDCHDENPCTRDFCVDGLCRNIADDEVVPYQIPGNCQAERCERGEIVLEEDNLDIAPPDGIPCTIAGCDRGVPTLLPDHEVCQDGDRCNGQEVCDLQVGCLPGTPVDEDEDGIPDLEDPDPPDSDGDGIIDCADWEDCDGLDNDGNGLVDDQPVDVEIGRWCYQGPQGTEGVGECVAGRIGCDRGELRCLGQVLPTAIEYCDGKDNDCDGEVPLWEVESYCRSEVTLTSQGGDPQLLRIEFPVSLRSVDVHFNIDTTVSMVGALDQLRNSLRSEIVPAVARVIPVAAFGVSTFEDFPLLNFGAADDLPFELRQRITTRVDLVQEALSQIELGSGLDYKESGIESLYQLASGAGVLWPESEGMGLDDPTGRVGVMGEIDPAGDVDYYHVSLSEGDFFEVAIQSVRIGSDIDLSAELYDATGQVVASGRDPGGIDLAFVYTAPSSSDYYLKVESTSTTARGWYFAESWLEGEGMVAVVDACSALEVGGDYFTQEGDAVDLALASEVLPRSDPTSCATDCLATIEDAFHVLEWVMAFCAGEGPPSCGNGDVDPGEECDDSNHQGGDGCSASCQIEREGVVAFDGLQGFDPNLGHGMRGGAGFRAETLPIIVHATDAPSHQQQEYYLADPRIGAHDTDDTFFELEKLGARIVGITTREHNSSSITDCETPRGMAFRTRSLVPPCAFDGTAGRLNGLCDATQCCVGQDGRGSPPPEGAGGLCPLSFEMDGDGRGLTDGVVAGINALTRYATYSVTPVVYDVAGNPADARCFLQSVQVHQVVQATDCSPEPTLDDRDGDGSLETVENATPNSRVTVDFWVENRDGRDLDGDLDVSEACGPPGSHTLQVEFTGDDVTVLGQQELRFTVVP
ncbi:MAG: pre-peptidase C-terminal domain-containing protein [Bradymonadales bacterium]|nr:pre-peptidase C-terminal domain-containing protein [Bradymonadales bacterium]